MMNMGSGSQILHLILFIFIHIFFFNSHLLMAGFSISAAENSNDPGLQEQYWMEYNVDGKENEIKKVSGGDESEEKRDLVFEKFRFLLGLKSFNIRSPTNDHVEHGFLSPSPAPSIEAEAPAPVPVVHHTHVHSHPPLPQSSPTPLPHDVRRGHRDKARVRRIVVAVAVSGGVASIFSALGLILMCRKFMRSRRKRSARAMLVSGANGRTKYVHSPHETSKVRFDLGPEHFYLNTLGPISEPDTSSLKPICGTVNISSEQNQTKSPLDGGSESGRESMKSKSDNACTSAEEITSVYDIEEPIKCESDCSSSMENKVVPVESLSSDDESFHSFCDSHYSSNLRISNASEGDLSDRSEVFSPPSYPMRSSTPDRSSTSPTPSTSMKSPTPPMTPDLTPPLHSNLQSSPLSCPSNPKQTTPISPSSSISPQHLPPPPPPPPLPRVHVFPSQSTSCSKQIAPTKSCSTMPNVSSPRNSDSSSGSNPTPPNEYPSSPCCKLQPASTSTPGGARSIPPPPCPPLLPPPFTKGRGNTIQVPPPPPGQLPQFTMVGKDGAPLPKLKPLHWDKVRAAPDRSMVWDKLRSSSFELDEKMIETLFGYNLQIKNDEAKSKSPSPSKHVLEPKRLQNITILSKALNATPEQVCNALIQGDGLCLQQLEALVKMVPTKEEEAKLSSYQGDVNELGSAEKFVKAMLNVPFAFRRIEAMLYKETFEDEVVHLRKSFAMLEEACKELRSSRLFLKLLEAVLKTGNRMNVGTIRGGARAFKLDALLKLADVKGTDGKTTLLHFVVQEMIRSEGIRELEITVEKTNHKTKSKTVEKKEENYRMMGLDLVSGLSTEFCNLKKTATIDLDVLASSVSNLSDGMIKLKDLLKDLLSEDFFMDNWNGNFVHLMRAFLIYAEKNINELQKDEDQVLLHVREITEYFHGDVSKDEANPLRIFVIVRDFLGMLDQVCKEVRTLKMPNIPNSNTPFR